MRTSTKLTLIALTAALLLAAALGTASARNFSISNVNARVTWSRLEFGAASVTVRCPVTLEGSFHSRTFTKAARALVGFVTRADLKSDSCTNGQGSLRNLPWHITYEGFTGTLPNISSVRLLLARWLSEAIVFGKTCRYGVATDNVTAAVALNVETGLTEITPVAGRNGVTLLEGTNPGELFSCPASGNMVSAPPDGAVRLLNSTTRIRLTLI